MSRSSSESSGMGIEYNRIEDAEAFVDPFAVESAGDEYEIPLNPADFGAGAAGGAGAGEDSSSRARVTKGGLPGVGGGGGSEFAAPNYGNLGSMDIAAAIHAGNLAAPMIGRSMAAGLSEERHFLAHERRSLWGQCSYNIGYSYFGGLMLGGAVGFLQGLRASPNRRARVLLNSVLNGMGRSGARLGNAAGVLALLYTCTERVFEDVEVDKFPGRVNDLLGHDVFGRTRADMVIPAATAFATGVLFTLPRAVTMKGVERHYVSLPKRFAVCLTGGLATVVGVGALAVAGPLLFGQRSPFRFA